MIQVDHDIFAQAIGHARSVSFTIRDATSPSDEYPRFGADYYLTADRLSGYGVTREGELIGLFSLVRGRGDALVTDAIAYGATSLECFDGYLPTFYGRHGFVETGRTPNWVEGESDVLKMKLGECSNRCDDGFIETVGGYGGGPGRCGLCNHPDETSQVSSTSGR